MAVRKRMNKKGFVYEVNFRYEADGIKRSYWKSGFKTKKEAQQHETEMKLELAKKGKLTQTTKTLKDVYDEFMEMAPGEFQHNTIYNTKKTLNHWHGRTATIDLGRVEISKIDYQLLQKYFNARLTYGKANNLTIKSALNRIFRYALRSGYISSNPLEYVKVQGVDNSTEKKPLTIEEYKMLLQELERNNTFDYQALAIAVKIGFFTGMRLSEVCGLHKEDIDFSTNKIHIKRKLNYKGLKKGEYIAVGQMKSKSSKASIPLPNALKKELIAWYEINPFDIVVCDSNGNYINCNSVSNKFRRIAKKLNITFHFHLLRHTYATYLVNSNVEIKVAQELLRHANFNTTMSVYAHVEDTKKAEVVNSVFGEFLAST